MMISYNTNVKPTASRSAKGISLGSRICARTLGTVAKIAKAKMKADSVTPTMLLADPSGGIIERILGAVGLVMEASKQPTRSPTSSRAMPPKPNQANLLNCDRSLSKAIKQ
eukprot:Skav231378  [mRNA]  locus=scaffold1586:806265:810157:+ [translate_table: standard]